MKFGVVVFPGSNCVDDMIHVIGNVMEMPVEKIWHKQTHLEGYTKEDCIILPGGFSYGDYVRAGAIARLSPIMQSVIEFSKSGGYIFGICNGFQILCESQLLPGVLLRNERQKFIAKNIFLKTISTDSMITRRLQKDQVIEMPIAHAEGRYYCDKNTLESLKANDQILFKYCTESGKLNDNANINGSIENIAGICNKKRNIFGMMPHPERASELILGNEDGKILFDSLINASVSI